MAKKTITIGFIGEILWPYLLISGPAILHHLGYIRLPASDQDRLTALSAAISVGSILFGFSGVILVTVSTISGSRVIRELRKERGLTKLFVVVIESLSVDFLFVSTCIIGLFGLINFHWFQTFWLFLFGLSVLKFFYSIIVLFWLIWCQVDDVALVEPVKTEPERGPIDPDDFRPIQD